MSKLSDALNWELKSGSHEWPGPQGGTCINEAAIVVAGFEYKSVKSADDCPPCFSRPISAYLIRINDVMPDDVRQRLIPFAVRLSGSADSLEIEQQRLECIVIQTVRRVLPISLRASGLNECAERCEKVETLEEAAAAADAAARYAARYAAAAAAADAAARYAARYAAAAAADAADAAARYAAAAAADARYAAARYAAAAAADADAVWNSTVEIVSEALDIGNQAPQIETDVIAYRVEKAKLEKAA